MLTVISPTGRSIAHALSADGRSIAPNINTLFRRFVDLGILIQHLLSMNTMQVLDSLLLRLKITFDDCGIEIPT